MCATPDKKALRERRSRTGTLRGWKVLQRYGGSLRGSIMSMYTYVAGDNRPRRTRLSLRAGAYEIARPRGLHVFRFKDRTWIPEQNEALVPVTYQPEDVIAAESPKVREPQVVVRKLRISQKAYDAALKG